MRRSLFVALAFLASGSALAAQQTQTDSMALGRKWTRWFYENKMDSIVMAYAQQAGPEAKQGLERSLLQLATRAGSEVSVVDEKFIKRNGATQYWRTAKFSAMEEPIQIRWAVNKQWQIIGMGMNPVSQAPPIDP